MDSIKRLRLKGMGEIHNIALESSRVIRRRFWAFQVEANYLGVMQIRVRLLSPPEIQQAISSFAEVGELPYSVAFE